MQKVFVSSTFLDFQAEREMMNNSVFPEFRKAAQKFGITPELIDLRWGIDNWSSGTDSITKTLDACLGAIQNSSAMIIFLGDRRGFIPDDVPDAIRKKFGLARKTDNTNKTKPSITGLEIEYAMMLREQFDGKVIICIRSITSIPSGLRSSYIDDNATQELDILKDRLRGNYDASVIDYTAEWTGQALGNFTAEGTPLADVLVARMKAMYRTEWELDVGIRWQDRVIKLSLRSIDDSTASFSSREKLINDIEDKLRSHRYLFLRAPEGFGKTTITSKLAQRLGAWCFFANSGFTDRPDNAQHMLELMVYCLEERLKCEHLVLQEEFSLSPLHESRYVRFKLRLEELCSELPDDEPAFLMIDGFDRLEADEHRDSADILPMTGNVHCLVSCSEGFEIPIAYKNSDEACVMGIEALKPEEVPDVLSKILGRNERELYAEAEQAVLSHSELTPLKLSMMAKLLDASITAQELEGLKENPRGITELVAKIISDVDDDPAKAACSVLGKAAARLFGNGARRILDMTEYITVSRNGLRLSDLAVLDEYFSESDFFLFVRYMDIFFMERQDGRIDFRHDCARRGLLAGMTKEIVDDVDRKIGRHVLGLPPDDALRNSEGFFYTIRFKDYTAAERLIDEVFESRDHCLQYEIDKHLMADEGKFCVEFLREHWDFMSDKLKSRLYSYLFIKAEVLSFGSATNSVQKIFRELSEMLTHPPEGRSVHSFTETALYSMGSYGSEFVLARMEMLHGDFSKSAERCEAITQAGESSTAWRKDYALCLLVCSAYLILVDDMHFLSRHRRALKCAEKAVEWALQVAELYRDRNGDKYLALSRIKVSQCKLFALNSSHLPEILVESREAHKCFTEFIEKLPSIENLQYVTGSCYHMAFLAMLLKDPEMLEETAVQGEKYAGELLSVSQNNTTSIIHASRLFATLSLAKERLGADGDAKRYAVVALRLYDRLKGHDHAAEMLKQEMMRITAGRRAPVSYGINKDIDCY